MQRFLANVTDPNDHKDKQNKAKDRKKEYKEYESKKRSQSYQTAWEQEFTWLQYKESECKMYCKICLEAFTKTNKQEFMSNFVIGTDNFKKDVVRNHDNCEIHAFKAKPFVEAKSKIPGTSEAEKIIRNLNQTCIAFFIQGNFVVQ